MLKLHNRNMSKKENRLLIYVDAPGDYLQLKFLLLLLNYTPYCRHMEGMTSKEGKHPL
jgi:hypothetical protein